MKKTAAFILVFLVLAGTAYYVSPRSAMIDFGIWGGGPNIYGGAFDKLAAGSLISDDKKIMILEVNKFIGVAGGLRRIPEEIDFMWRLEGEKYPKSQKIKVRSKIPTSVLRRIDDYSFQNTVSLNFFVRNDVPEFQWVLKRMSNDPDGATTTIARGGYWPK